MNIVLIGYRGTGKSTIGRQLANHLHRDFIDTDALLVERAGKSIRQIFEENGEPFFRDLESAVITSLTSRDNLVIAAGGGVILRPANVTALKKNGRFIWLQADATTLHTRITADPSTPANRPNLLVGQKGGGGGLKEIEKLLAIRTPLYHAAADASLDVTHLSVEHAITHLTRLIQETRRI